MSSNSSKPTRRIRTAAEKARILAEYEAAASPLARAELMRREGVYASLISNWRKQLNTAKPQRGRPTNADAARIQQLERQVKQLQQRAEQAEDLVETLGKVHALLQNAANKSATDTQQSKKRS